jgi:hypothetical protein
MPDTPSHAPHHPARAGWRHGTAPGGAAARPNRGPLRAFVLITLLAVAGTILGLSLWPRAPVLPRFLTVPICQYRDRAWPPNPWAERDCDLLRACFADDPENGFDHQERNRFLSFLDKLAGEAKAPVVLHLTALARVRDGTVYVLPGDAVTGDITTWVKLDDVLGRFGSGSAPRKLLLLDLAHATADPFRGPLFDDVADRVVETVRRSQLDYPVFCSCSPGETSLPLDDERASVVAFYLAAGLRGAADGCVTGQVADGRVTVREVTTFVAARVSRWAERNRGVRQTPVLLGRDADFPLTYRLSPEPESGELPGPSTATYPRKLSEGWQERDRHRDAELYRTAPVAYARLVSAVLQAEREWEAGRAKWDERLDNDLQDLRRVLKTTAEPALRLPSLVAARAGAKEPPADVVKAIDTWAAARTPEELDKARGDLLAKAKAAPADAAGLIWARLLADREPTQKKLRDLAALLAELQPAPTEETILLRRLVRWTSPYIEWPARGAYALLQVEAAAGQVAAQLPAGFPGVSDRFGELHRKKRDGERALLEATATAAAGDAANQLDELKREFVGLREQLARLQAARRAVEDAVRILAEAAPGVIEGGPQDEQAWADGARAARALADLLAGQAAPSVVAIDGHVDQLDRAVRALNQRYAPGDLPKWVAAYADGGSLVKYGALRRLLDAPLLKASTRPVVWAAARHLSGELHAETRKLDAVSDWQPTTPARPGAEGDRAARRALVSIGLLQILDPEAGDRLAAVRRAMPNGASAKEWQTTLADPLRDAWIDRLPRRYQEFVEKRQWAAADRLSRVPPAVSGLLPPGPDTPAVRMRQAEREACKAWLDGQFKEYARARGAVEGAAAFYEEAARTVAGQ